MLEKFKIFEAGDILDESLQGTPLARTAVEEWRRFSAALACNKRFGLLAPVAALADMATKLSTDV